MIKKVLPIILSAITAVSAFSACSDSKKNDESGKLDVVCTIFPQYDWVKQIAGDNIDNINLKLLLDNGVDLHSYQPTAEDIITISECDLFIYIGGESDAWVDDVLKDSKNKDMKVLNLMDILGDAVREEEIVEGMESEEEEHDEAEEEPEYDEHIWLSLKNASIICSAISDSLSELDSDNADAYKASADSYISEIDALNTEFVNDVEASERNIILFGDRFPFRYLADDYSLDYYAAFAGCSAETEASFETLVFLADKVDELDLPAVLCVEGSNEKIAKAVVENTDNKDQKILVMNSLQSITSKDVESGISYLSIMEENLDVLKEALN